MVEPQSHRKIPSAQQTAGMLALLSFSLVTGSCGELSNRTLSHRIHNRGYQSDNILSASVVSKSDKTPFYLRLPTNTGRLLVTDSVATNSGTDLVIPANKKLYSIELVRSGAKQLRNELYREERLVLFFAQDDQDAVQIVRLVEEFPHPLRVDTRELKHPADDLDNPTPSSLALPETVIDSLAGAGRVAIVIDAVRMREDLESLSGVRPVLVNGQSVTISNRATPANKINARAWLRSNYEALGFTVSEHKYATGTNLIAEKRAESPLDDQIFIVSGHLDTVNTAGADDDGSGIISGLSIARSLVGVELKRTIRFVAFDEEEKGLIGSAAYATELVRVGEISKISLFNIEMTGYDIDNDGRFHSIDCNENSSATLTTSLLSSILSEGIKLIKVDACTTRSDHAVFWNHNRPAIVMSQNFFGGDSNPCYHRTCDTVQSINWEYMTKMTQAAANAVANINR